MGTDELRNLAKIGQLKPEAAHVHEVSRMLSMAVIRLDDAALENLSLEGRFTSAYNASHAAALAALRWHGYRSENRFTVFQCLAHTLGWSSTQWRVLDAAHQKRNLAEYEGYLDVEETLVVELVELTQKLIKDVQALVDG
jgi:hypothetical protein